MELQCIGHFKLLVSLLGLDSVAVADRLAVEDTVAVQGAVLRLLATVCHSGECVADIAAAEVRVRLMVVHVVLGVCCVVNPSCT